MPKNSRHETPIHPAQARDNYICQYCGKDGLASLDNWHDCCVDHLIPRKYGGDDTLTNLVTSCSYCNSIKGERLFGSLDEAREYVMRRRGELATIYQRVFDAIRRDAARHIALVPPPEV